jgi:sugar phosphate isomerase/epimerase
VDLGACLSSLDQVAALESARADYYDLPLARVAERDDREFERLHAQASGLRLQPRAYNVFLPGDLKVVGPAVDGGRVQAYLAVAFDRARSLGGHIVGFGSGPSRSVPDGFSRTAAGDQLHAFIESTARVAAGYGITLAVEPLRHAESNVFTSLRETAAFLRERRLEGVGLVADLYHMMEEGEDFSALDDCGQLLLHVQVADSGRRAPGRGTYDTTGFLRRLHTIGYSGDCSIECRWEDFSAQIGPAMTYLRQAAQVAGW